MLQKFMIAICVYTLGIAAAVIIGIMSARFFVWYETNPLYPVLHWIRNRISVIMVLVLVVGYIVIFLHYFEKVLGYLEEVIRATENVYSEREEWISLPSELGEVETQMNQIKQNVMQKERIAREAEQRKNDLVVYLAHDLKTPLTSVIGYLTLLRDERRISEELQEKYLSIALDKAERLEYLINEFFEITRFNLSNITLEKGQVNLSRMLEQLVYEFGPMFREKGLKCDLQTEPELMLCCDIDKMQRVFDNLLRNAVNYSYENSRIQIVVRREEGKIHMTFVNCGPTISEEKLERIFEQFYRLDSARTTKSGGAGLGLAIAKEIVELHGGTIRAFSADEQIVFELLLPNETPTVKE